MKGMCFSYIAFWISATGRLSSLMGLLHWISPQRTTLFFAVIDELLRST